MNEFLNTLAKALKKLGTKEKQEILSDYAEHFEIGLEAGKTEAEIIKTLGDPNELAKMYMALGATRKAHETKGIRDTLRMIGAIVRYKVGGGILAASLYFVPVSFMFILYTTSAALVAGGISAAAYAVLMFIQEQTAFGLLGLFTFLVLLSGGILSWIGCKRLWKVTVGNLSCVARKIMQKRVTIDELDTYKR